MQSINWSELQPLPADLNTLRECLREAVPLRQVCQLLVETTLRAFPWTGRADLLPCYHPSQTYQPGQSLALSVFVPGNVRRIVWLLGQVKQAKFVENPVQGRFQVLTLEIQGRQVQMVGGIAGASYPEPDLSHYTSEDFAWLVKWISNTYAASLLTTVQKLILNGQIGGRLAGEIFLPEGVSAVSPELLHPVFARLSPAQPWISVDEISRNLPELSQLERKTILAFLRATLKQSSYRALGADRWTTPELFDQLNRDVLQAVPAVPVRSNVSIRTKRDEQDLAGYGTKFMPVQAQRLLEELGVADLPSEPDDSAWRPPKNPMRLPALNYLHITQAFFPVRSVMRLFAPELQMVFVQFINGEHQPFLLDRDNGLLKAIHPEALQSKILEHDLPAGTSLWLEYQDSEKYRITPRLLPFKRRVPCKLAYLEDSRLHIEHTHISMTYEGTPSLFKANLRLKEMQALFAEANRVHLSVREAMIYAIQEICATDPDHRAHWLDLFNAVFLQRMCSPQFLSFLLYTQPCFETLKGGYFHYKPMPAAVRKTRKRRDRLSQLWDDLLSDPVAPRPVLEQRTAVEAGQEVSHLVSRSFAPDLGLPSIFSQAETEPEISVATALEEAERIEPILMSEYEPEGFTPTPAEAVEAASTPWRDSLEKLLHSLVELENTDTSPLSVDEATSEQEAPSDASIEAAHEESLSFSSPFRWDPRPAWVNTPAQPKPASPGTVDPRRLVYKPNIPLRPLHKQRFYHRFFFYLRKWLSGSFRKAV